MKKAYCDFCGKEISEEDELDLDGKNYLIPSVYRDEIEKQGLISVSAIEDCCLECCRKFDTFVAKLRKA
jgi:DNA-binding transcriptional regulator/RsmH inhibitor MraZ